MLDGNVPVVGKLSEDCRPVDMERPAEERDNTTELGNKMLAVLGTQPDEVCCCAERDGTASTADIGRCGTLVSGTEHSK